MWKVTNSERPFLLLLREPNGTAGCVGGLEVGLGSLVWDCMLRGRIPREGCTDFQPELPMLPFLSMAVFIFHGVSLADTGCKQLKIFSGTSSFAPGSVVLIQESFLDSLRS